MVSVNKSIFPFLGICFIIISCNFKSNYKVNQNTTCVTAISAYSDSIFYTLNINSQHKQMEFLTTKKLFVDDSCFGSYTDENIKEALLYVRKNNMSDPYVKYFIKVKDQENKFKQLWIVTDRFDTFNYIELGIGHNLSAINKASTSDFLKIIRRQEGSLTCQCLNFSFINNSWKLLSKEKITTDKFYNMPIGYCIDTINKQINVRADDELSPNEIDFDRAFFDAVNTKFKCNESKYN